MEINGKKKHVSTYESFQTDEEQKACAVNIDSTWAARMHGEAPPTRGNTLPQNPENWPAASSILSLHILQQIV
jgi:hypothetical protein